MIIRVDQNRIDSFGVHREHTSWWQEVLTDLDKNWYIVRPCDCASNRLYFLLLQNNFLENLFARKIFICIAMQALFIFPFITQQRLSLSKHIKSILSFKLHQIKNGDKI